MRATPALLRRLPVAAVLAVPALLPAAAQDAASLACGLEAGPERAVARVIDGATVRLDDGKEVRLAGLLAPRAADAGASGGAWPPETASREALTALVGGRTVALAFAGRREDRWGRVVAHLFVADEGSKVWVQRRLVEEGQARVHPAPDGDDCGGGLLAAEREARAASRGLWSNAAYEVRPADRPGELARYRGTFQLVRGTVAKVGGTRSLVILEFVSGEQAGGLAAAPAAPPAGAAGAAAAANERSRRGAMRIVWRRSLDPVPETGARALEGATLLARGWIDVRGGPEIEVLARGQLEVESASASRGRQHGRRSRSPQPDERERPAEDPPGAEKR